MKLYFTNQRSKFREHLASLKAKPVMQYDATQLRTKITTVEIATAQKLDQLDFGFLFDYKVFPVRVLEAKTQWQDEGRPMKTGDTIVQQVRIPPVMGFSQKIIVGVRINSITDHYGKKGYSYETLEGHVEKGISAISVEQQENKLVCNIQTYSAPGNFWIRLLGPVFALPYQAYCTRKALDHVKKQIEAQLQQQNF